ncbi:hypothetical protein [Jidongwangia harbinensis]|uniref:hypothetical protein n=1 Tax=Jidongwangia harbinensis TaxID=2878561 RepID=UPI001CD92EEA|nr:hypothetical protein [Jidongwangia harbinensis]MCA2211341.1 hypothetical protein [Jidongwangia harbinensis]
MLVTAAAPARRPGGTAALPLRLVAAYDRGFGPPGADRPGPGAEEYLSDLVASGGGRFRPEILRAGGYTAFTTMARRLVDELGPGWSSVDLVILCHAVPDLDHRRFPGTFLTGALPAAPLGLTLCDQGSVVPFSALRVAGAYAATVPLRHILVLILDQATVPWHVADRTGLPATDRAVALLLEPAPGPGRPGLPLRQFPGVAPDEVGALLKAHLPDLAGEHDRVRVIASPAVPADHLGSVASPVTVARPGQLCTAGWSQLARAGRTRAPGRTVLIGYDARLRHLCLAAVDSDEQP